MRRYIEVTREINNANGNIVSSTDLRIHYTYRPGCEARTYGPADDCFPAEASEVEVDFLEGEEGGRWVRFDRPRDPLASMEAMAADSHYDWAESWLQNNMDQVEENEADLAAEAEEYRAEMRADR